MPEPTCPYCGDALPSADTNHCESCGGVFVPSAGPTARRRRRRRPSTALVLTLSLMLLCQVAVFLFIFDKSGGLEALRYREGAPGPDRSGQETPDNPPAVERTAAQVATMSVPAMSVYTRMKAQAVPEPFEQRFAQVAVLIEQANRAEQDQRYTQAYTAYHEARLLMRPLQEQIEQWQADRAVRDELALARQEVAALRDRAGAADASRWSPKAWSAGEAAWGQSAAFEQAAQYDQAFVALGEAGGYYRDAWDDTQNAGLALDALARFNERMKAGYSEQLLREHAGPAVDELLKQRAAGAEALSALRFTEAERAYVDAIRALDAAEQAVDLARHRKLYAFEAGMQAASLLFAVASGDGIGAEPREALIALYDRLGLPNNPATALKIGAETGYDQAAQQLVTTARSAITARHAPAVQACYHAGFQVSIITLTLKSESLTGEQQKRVHQSLGVMEQQAQAAGWNMQAISKAIESVRTTNRNARLKAPPTDVRAAWERFTQPFADKQATLRLIDPQAWPSAPEDPELFKGLGTVSP